MCCHSQSQTQKLPSLSVTITKKLFNGVALRGGTSFNSDLEEPTSGYMVSMIEGPVLPSMNFYPTDKNWTEAKAHQIIHGFVKANLSTINKDYFFGSWKDSETGKAYIGIAFNFESKETALDLAGRNNQIAIWDVKNNCEIRLQPVD